MSVLSSSKFLSSLLVISSSIAFSACAYEPVVETEKGWTALFNGKNLDGWLVKFAGSSLGENYRDTFQVVDGKLTVSYENYQEFKGEYGHLFYQQPFSHYLLRAEYRFIGEQVNGGEGWAIRNNGFMLHSQDPTTMTVEQKFPASIEVQLLGGLNQGERPTANICTPDTHVVIDGKLVKEHCIKSTSKTFNGDQWVTIEMEVHGSERIIHRINGEVVFDYTEPQFDEKTAQTLIEKNGNVLLGSGYIAIQAETAPIEFRKIEIKELAVK